MMVISGSDIHHVKSIRVKRFQYFDETETWVLSLEVEQENQGSRGNFQVNFYGETKGSVTIKKERKDEHNQRHNQD